MRTEAGSVAAFGNTKEKVWEKCEMYFACFLSEFDNALEVDDPCFVKYLRNSINKRHNRTITLLEILIISKSRLVNIQIFFYRCLLK